MLCHCTEERAMVSFGVKRMYEVERVRLHSLEVKRFWSFLG
jgi:hypothetical protein